MAAKRKSHTAAFKALAAHKSDRTVNELAGHYGVHPALIHAWKKPLVLGAEEIFGSPTRPASAGAEARQAALFEQIGRLKMELEWLKKRVGGSRVNLDDHWSRSAIRPWASVASASCWA
jgi:putative transposase